MRRNDAEVEAKAIEDANVNTNIDERRDFGKSKTIIAGSSTSASTVKTPRD